jgi:dephospho-CoA kinase
VYVIDPNGIEYLKAHCGDEYNFVTMYVVVPYSIGEQRSVKRGETVEEYARRYHAEDKQFSDFEKRKAWDFLIINDGEIEIAFLQALRAVQKTTWKDEYYGRN